MKVLSLIALVLIFLFITTINFFVSGNNRFVNELRFGKEVNPPTEIYLPPVGPNVIYHARAELDDIEKSLEVSCSIYLMPEKISDLDSLLFFLGFNDVILNGGHNKSTGKRVIDFSNFDFDEIKINGNAAEMKFVDFASGGISDSAIGFIELNDDITASDTVIISLDYKITIQPDSPSPGYAEGREFYYISNWLPHVIPLASSQQINNTFVDRIFEKTGSSFYYVDLILPEGLKLLSSSAVIDSSKNDDGVHYKLDLEYSSNFSWIAAEEIESTKFNIELNSGFVKTINLFTQPENDRYISRYKEAVSKSLNYFSENFNLNPYSAISLVDVPQTSKSAYLATENLITIKSEILSTRGLAEIEFYTAKMIGKLFLRKVLDLENSANHWIVEGLSSLYATEIVNKYFEAPKLSFKFAYHYPVYGMNHLSFNDIPVVYSLAELEYDLGLKSLSKYYENVTMGKISDCFYHYPDLDSFESNKHIKPYLLIKSLIEREGIENFNKMISEVIDIRIASGRESETIFIELLENLGSTPIDQFIHNSSYVDYAIKSVEKTENNKYKVLAERKGDAVCSAEILLHTDNGVIRELWHGKERFKIFTFTTSDKVHAAEIVLTDVKYLDINFANNSYTLESQYWGSMSLAIRIFFWFQNAIMIFGSAS
jgi:hypothetical protein